jgi:hypothetical protein
MTARPAEAPADKNGTGHFAHVFLPEPRAIATRPAVCVNSGSVARASMLASMRAESDSRPVPPLVLVYGSPHPALTSSYQDAPLMVTGRRSRGEVAYIRGACLASERWPRYCLAPTFSWLAEGVPPAAGLTLPTGACVTDTYTPRTARCGTRASCRTPHLSASCAGGSEPRRHLCWARHRRWPAVSPPGACGPMR